MITFNIPKRAAIELGLPEYFENQKCEFGHEAYRDVVTNICSECEINFKTFSHTDNKTFTTALLCFVNDGDAVEYQRKVSYIKHEILERFKRKFKARRTYYKKVEKWNKQQKRLQLASIKRDQLMQELEAKRKFTGKVLFNDYRDIMK